MGDSKDYGVRLDRVKVVSRTSLYPSLEHRDENVDPRSDRSIENSGFQPVTAPKSKMVPEHEANSEDDALESPQKEIKKLKTPIELFKMSEQYCLNVSYRFMFLKLIMSITATVAVFIIAYGGFLRFGAYHINPFFAANNETSDLNETVLENDPADSPAYLTVPLNRIISLTLLQSLCILLLNSAMLFCMQPRNIDRIISMICACSRALTLQLVFSIGVHYVEWKKFKHTDMTLDMYPFETRTFFKCLLLLVIMFLLIITQMWYTRLFQFYMIEQQELHRRVRASFLFSKFIKLVYFILSLSTFVMIQLSPVQFGAPLNGCTDEVCPSLRVPWFVYFWPSSVTLSSTLFGLANLFLEDLQPVLRRMKNFIMIFLAVQMLVFSIVCAYLCDAHNLAVPWYTWAPSIILALFSICSWKREKTMVNDFLSGKRRAMMFTRHSRSVSFNSEGCEEREQLQQEENRYRVELLQGKYGSVKGTTGAASASTTSTASSDTTSTEKTSVPRSYIEKERGVTCYMESSLSYINSQGDRVCREVELSFLPAIVYLPSGLLYASLYLRTVVALTAQSSLVVYGKWIEVDSIFVLIASHGYYCLRLIEQIASLGKTVTLPLQTLTRGFPVMLALLLYFALLATWTSHFDPRVILCFFVPALLEFLLTLYVQFCHGTLFDKSDKELREVYVVPSATGTKTILGQGCVRPDAPGAPFSTLPNDDFVLSALSLNRTRMYPPFEFERK